MLFLLGRSLVGWCERNHRRGWPGRVPWPLCSAADVNGVFNLPQHCFAPMAWAFVGGVDSVDGRFRQSVAGGARSDGGTLGTARRCPRCFAVDKACARGTADGHVRSAAHRPLRGWRVSVPSVSVGVGGLGARLSACCLPSLLAAAWTGQSVLNEMSQLQLGKTANLAAWAVCTRRQLPPSSTPPG